MKSRCQGAVSLSFTAKFLITRIFPRAFTGLISAILALFAAQPVRATGTWAALSKAPPLGVNHAILLSDGSVYTDNGNGQCCRLTPDIHGSYINGTWTVLDSMNYSRLFFTSVLLTNGNVFVAGGEDGAGGRHAEILDPVNNVWTKIPDPLPTPVFSDSSGKILPNGNVLIAPVSDFGPCIIYNAATNGWQTAASAQNQDESCWVKLANDCILTIDSFSQNAEHYVPSLNEWVTDGTVPVALYGFGGELGPSFLLPNGKAFFVGATANTGIYTPGSSATAAGSWVAGPTMIFNGNELGAVDAPGAMMVNGKILLALGPDTGYDGPTSFYEYDYTTNGFAQAPAPGGGTAYNNSAPFGTSMLCLADGNVLFIGGQNTQSLYVYTPDGTPLAQGQPAINTITENTDGTYTMTGTNLTGISEGAAYGDDEQMNSNYPLVRMTNSSTHSVYYARTFNWNSTSVQTAGRIITTKFSLPTNMPAGTYSLVAVANGNASAPTNFTYLPTGTPSGVTAVGGDSSVTLNWSAIFGATAYNVKRSPTSTGHYSTIATLTSGTSYTNTALTNGVTYYYKISSVGTNGPSPDSTSFSVTPSGPTPIPGATNISLTSYFSRTSVYTDGRTFTGGLDGGGAAFSANQLGTSVIWNGIVFGFGPANSVDSVVCTGQTIALPAGQYNTLQFLATAFNGSQTAQAFTVHYTDGSTATFTQSLSDWASPQNFEGETSVVKMYYRDTSGSQSYLTVNLNGYIIALDETKTVQSITLPNNSSALLFAIALAKDSAPVALDSYFDRAGIYTDGTTYTNPATGGIDLNGYSLSGTFLTPSVVWTNTLFEFGPFNATNVISCAGQTVSLPPGSYSKLRMLGTGVNGSQTSQQFVVTYSDSTTTTFSQSFSDWFGPQNYTGETKAVPMGYRNSSDGSSGQNTALYLYGYQFTLNQQKTLQSIRLPSNANVIIAAMTAVPDWPPGFNAYSYTLPTANAGFNYAASIASDATDLNGDAITYAKVSGPAWLGVSASGSLSGVPANSDANLNTFVVSARDSAGMSNAATIYINVNGAPSFTENPFSIAPVTAGQLVTGNISTNATDPNPGDTLTYALVSGPSWLTVGPDGTLSGEPASADLGTNAFTVSVTDQGGLVGAATLNILVTPAAPIVPMFAAQGSGQLLLSWSGGAGPFQVQITTSLDTPNWQDAGGPVSTNTILISPTNRAAFYRIVGQ